MAYFATADARETNTSQACVLIVPESDIKKLSPLRVIE